MSHDVDRIIEALSEEAQRLSSADLPRLAKLARNQVAELRAMADDVVGPLRRWQAVVAYTGKDWLGEPYRQSYLIRSFIVHFLARGPDPKEEARQMIYSYGPLFQRAEEWTVVDLQLVAVAP